MRQDSEVKPQGNMPPVRKPRQPRFRRLPPLPKKIPTTRKIPKSEIARQELRDEVRMALTAQFHQLTGLSDSVVPWTYIWKAAVDHRLVIIGSPLNRPLTSPLTDPTHLLMDDLRAVASVIRKGECRFARVTDEQFEILAASHQADIEAGRIEPPDERQIRSDSGETRGAHLHPDTRTKTRLNGKIICSKSFIESDIESDNEEWLPKRGSEPDSNPIEDWGWNALFVTHCAQPLCKRRDSGIDADLQKNQVDSRVDGAMSSSTSHSERQVPNVSRCIWMTQTFIFLAFVASSNPMFPGSLYCLYTPMQAGSHSC
ncbi:hypothetical protein QCA50_010424 [Cerrena zonata]|uniref:Uncharacterized protein n=1 Tax=Cerrena zonata TaxID=2478898 RepID=A0AAW0G3D5_9APHY